ncbi:hypothetical protein AMYX_39590 [Anaeromyxobacter diazotrophicus]|uniref:Uncharacterized protein n=1 Tax=Anaeromyxobacter diazotrophicus TaxID=2590199 RepID=A0A7I9VSM6_9BACT|nr:hypothetical protein AMYX_39590 [Anaeromyxobacter diazotrophicus]
MRVGSRVTPAAVVQGASPTRDPAESPSLRTSGRPRWWRAAVPGVHGTRTRDPRPGAAAGWLPGPPGPDRPAAARAATAPGPAFSARAVPRLEASRGPRTGGGGRPPRCGTPAARRGSAEAE